MGLHKKISSLGSLTGRTLKEIAAVCGKPTKVWERDFTDIGGGTQAIWKTPLFSFCLNFDREEKCCGIAYTHDLTPYVLLLGISVVIVSTILLLLKIF